MAKQPWLNIDPASGNGNGTIRNTASVHTGRVTRETTVTVRGTGVSSPATYKAKQKPKEEFVSFDNGSEMSAPKGGGTVTVQGKSNSQALTFSWVGEVDDVPLPGNYTANGEPTANGADIDGDPGAANEYAHSVLFNFPANNTVEEVERVLKVTAKGGQEAQITINQAAGDAFITVDPQEITLEADGSEVIVTVKSNTQWTAE